MQMRTQERASASEFKDSSKISHFHTSAPLRPLDDFPSGGCQEGVRICVSHPPQGVYQGVKATLIVWLAEMGYELGMNC